MTGHTAIIVALIGGVTGVFASSGYWARRIAKCNRTDATTKLLMGLAHDRIAFLGMHYVDKGEITKDQYENLHDYLYEPYKQLGGNGSASKIMDAVSKLDLRG